MLAKFLEGTRNCRIPNGGLIQLEYFLLEKENEQIDNITKTYGIEIVKKCNHFGETIYTETDQIECLTCKKEKAQEIINKLISNSVTPISMLYIIDDMMDEAPCV